MADRYNKSPTKASPYAFWTYRNVWLQNATHEDLQRHKKIEDLSANSVRTNKNVVQDSDSETAAASVIAANEPHALYSEDEEIRKNVWSDVDDELYIANLIKSRTSDEVKRDVRDTSVNSDISERVVSSVKLEYNEMWDIEPTDLTECDCLGPPPEFLLPPPPRPPFLQAEYYCGDDPIPDLETCDTEPKIDAYNHSGPSFQTSAVIALCSIVLVLGIFVGAILVW
ncbi:hypothetical protein ACJJTC_002294, partial [Scirpophaga incertulas]